MATADHKGGIATWFELHGDCFETFGVGSNYSLDIAGLKEKGLNLN